MKIKKYENEIKNQNSNNTDETYKSLWRCSRNVFYFSLFPSGSLYNPAARNLMNVSISGLSLSTILQSVER